MILHPNITKLNITEDIINHFFLKTKLSEHNNITNIELIRSNKVSHVLRIHLEPNKASNQPKRTQTTLEININKLLLCSLSKTVRDYKLNKILNIHNNETI